MKTPTMKPMLLLLTLCCGATHAQTLIRSWTEQNGVLGLGYPVPIPVDTTEPFDGFRSYNGLFTKHQSMAMSNALITGQVVGQTHYNRDIWAYVLSDADNTTQYGVKEGAMMINGGIHAREWQSPETVTQIITDFHDHSDDNSFYQYLLENSTIITIPVNNVDGFLQTQRYPTDNWLGDDITSPQFWPRDGRMRRKNMRDTDEDLNTQNDHLNGVDLNRNNNPYWATSNSSSGDVRELRYHGPFVDSEPETQARLAAADLVDEDQFRVYTDVHSYSQVHFSETTFNQNRNTLQRSLLSDFSRHHQALPGAKRYVDIPSPAGSGIGSTDEYFAVTYEIPSWTLEIEPTSAPAQGQVDTHPELPGFGADYGGFAINGHDGFILPDAEIRRVRENLAETFMVVWYGQAGPPSITQLRVIDPATNAIVFDAEWDMGEDGQRTLHQVTYQDILSGKDYSLLIRFDKPMRWRNESGDIAPLPGQSTALNPIVRAELEGEDVNLNLSNHRWVNEKSSAWESYGYYKDDTAVVDFNIDPAVNAADTVQLNWRLFTTDMVGQSLDADPQTAVTWAGGQWINYEDSNGEASIIGGFDTTIDFTVSNQAFGPAVAYPSSALYFDPARAGEGFNIEVLDGNQVLMQWYTFDATGQAQWFLSANQIAATNAYFFPEVLQASGGVFGPDFDPEAVELSAAGSVEMIFLPPEPFVTATNETLLSFRGNMKYTYPDGRKFRTSIQQIAAADGIVSLSEIDDIELPPPALTGGSLIGSWFDPTRGGEGFHLQQTINGNAVILWYSYGLDGGQDWFIGSGGAVTETNGNVNIVFDEVYQARGGVFGADFNPNDVQLFLWGRIELNLQCTSGTFAFTALDDAYGTGTYNVVPITRPAANTLVCEQ